MCLPACPTYAMTPRERANPRGRIGLMRAVARGELEADEPGFATAMYYCLACRACETACPAGVEFGRLVEAARALVEEVESPGRPASFARDWLLDRVVARPRRLRWGARLLRLYQRALAPRPRWRRWFADRFPDLAQAEPLLPDVPAQGRRWRLPAVVEPDRGANGAARPVRGTVAQHPGCVQASLLPHVGADTAGVLAHHGWRVDTLAGARCCGALHAHHGRLRSARSLARDTIAAFEASGAERLVSNSAGCGAHMEGYRHLLADDPTWAERAARLSEAAVDVCEHLAATGLRRPARPFSLTATYADPCHLVHGQRVAEAPRLLLGAIPGLDLVPLPEATRCCGSAGLYNLTHPDAARELAERKVDHIRSTGAELVLTGNPGCHLQIAAGLRAAGSPVRVFHPVSLLRVAYELPPLLPRR